MPSFAIALLIIAISYLFGSVPFGYLAAKAKGVDIRKHGSGNIGATNIRRVLGPQWGMCVLLLDAGKGYAAVACAAWLNHALPIYLQQNAGFASINALTPVLAKILAAICVVIGHSFPIWLRFKGGKGVATSAGVMLALVAPAALLAFVVWMLLFFTTRYVSIASIGGALSLPVSVFFWSAPDERGALICLTLVICFLVIWLHRGNIRRLIDGTEHRFVKERRTP